LKRIYTTILSNLNLDVSKKINITNIKCKVDANKYVRVDGELWPIVNTEVLAYKDMSYTKRIINGVMRYLALKELKYFVKNEDKIEEKSIIHLFVKTVILTTENYIVKYNTTYGIWPEYKIIRKEPINDVLRGKTIDDVEAYQINNSVSITDTFYYVNNISNYNDDGQFYVLYNNNNYPIVKGIAYINKNINVVYGSDNKVYALFDADSYLTHNMHVLKTNEREGNVRMLKIKNAVDIPHNENIIIETKIEDNNYLYGKYLIEFNENEE
jgi:hypothetical protein